MRNLSVAAILLGVSVACSNQAAAPAPPPPATDSKPMPAANTTLPEKPKTGMDTPYVPTVYSTEPVRTGAVLIPSMAR
jgi:hypothetical protein